MFVYGFCCFMADIRSVHSVLLVLIQYVKVLLRYRSRQHKEWLNRYTAKTISPSLNYTLQKPSLNFIQKRSNNDTLFTLYLQLRPEPVLSQLIPKLCDKHKTCENRCSRTQKSKHPILN